MFVLLNTFLAYGRFPLEAKLWIGVLWLTALFFALRVLPPPSSDKPIPHPSGEPSPVPAWAPVLLFLLAAIVRWYVLTTLSVWPMGDDGEYGYFAIQLAEKWHWRLFFGTEQLTPLYTWLQALYFRVLEPSPATIRLYMALVSVLSLPLVYWTARRYFSRSFSLLCLFLTAFSFWPVYVSNFNDIGLNFIWQLLVILLMGFWRDSLRSGEKPKAWLPWVLGLAVGGGWFVSKFWPPNIPLFILWGAFLIRSGRPGGRKKMFLRFLVPVFLSLLPLVWLSLSGDYGNRIYNTLALTRAGTLGGTQVATSLSYLTAFFWGVLVKSYFTFGPLWGGLFNPLLGSAFLIGVIELSRTHKIRFWKWVLLTSVFLLAPAMCSNQIEIVRTFSIFPFFLFIIVVGLRTLAAESGKWKYGFLAIFLALSCGLDAYHLSGPYHRWSIPGVPNRNYKSVESYNAYEILRQKSVKDGPGYILSAFKPDFYDQTLFAATYAFNAGRNPRLSSAKPSWCALLTQAPYRPYLSRRFPSAEFTVLSPKGLRVPGRERILAVIPVSCMEAATLRRWREANRRIQELYPLVPFHVDPDYMEVIRALFRIRQDYAQDPLLRAWIFEKIYRCLELQGNYLPAFPLLREPIPVSFTFPFLNREYAVTYHRLGWALLVAGYRDAAQWCFRRAFLYDPKYPLHRYLLLCAGPLPRRNR